MQGVHLEGAATLVGHLVIIPPGELRNENLLVVAYHEEIVYGILQHVLTAIGQQNLLFRHTVYLTEAYGNHTFFALVIDAGIETQRLGIKILYSFSHLLTGLEVKFISVKIIHILCLLYYSGCKGSKKW